MSIVNEFKSLLGRLNALNELDYEKADELLHDAKIIVKTTYPDGSEHLEVLNNVTFKPTDRVYNTGHHAYKDYWRDGYSRATLVIKTCIKEIELKDKYPELQTNDNTDGGNNWYKKPIGIVALSVISIVIGLVIKHFVFST
ncbi:MAG: hypothetical protein OEL79_11320 [Chromatiales bacterium]|nr:hypothetical protein [Chromatiales bacterium]